MKSTRLESHRRGDTFVYDFTLAGDWVSSMFETLRFTLRVTEPASGVTDDNDAIAQASLANSKITFSDGKHGTVTFTPEETTAWPVGLLLWDLQGSWLAGAQVRTLDSGGIPVLADITRQQP